ncbi:MAG: tetratricopeptide repeat protein [Flavobacteriales bacterium]|nr:tetratricopeptide repeat protein [Flavobacteriales bacterium]
MGVSSDEKKILNEVTILNNSNGYRKVLRILTQETLQKYSNANLYTEKSKAAYGLRKDKACKKATEEALKIDKNNTSANHYLANILLIEEDYEMAQTHYNIAINNYEKVGEKNKEWASSLCNIGLIYKNQKKYDQAIIFYNKALDIESMHLCAHIKMGTLYANLKQIDLSLSYFKKAIEIDNTSIEANTGIGSIYYELQNYDKAESFFQIAIETDKNYEHALNFLGNISLSRNRLKVAKDFFRRALNSNKKYAEAYNNLAITYKKEKEHEEALSNFNKAISLNNANPQFYFNRAELKCETQNFGKAKSDFQNCINHSKEINYNIARIAKIKIKEIDIIEENGTIKQLDEIIKKIKKLLSFKNNTVVHYTSMSTLKSLILDNSPFRLSEGSFMNDTSEGDILFNYIGVRKQHTEERPEQFVKHPFIGSFVSEKNFDDLNHWRMYGKENNREATGCSFVVSLPELKKEIKNSIDSSSNKISPDLNVFRIAYMNVKNKTFNVPGLSKAKVLSLNSEMKQLLLTINKFLTQSIKKEEEVHEIIKLLSEIKYLFKSSVYEYEKELRLIILGEKYKKSSIIINDQPRVFIEIAPLRKSITKITLGPKVDKAEEWSALFFYNMQSENLDDKIYISKQPFK